MWWMIPAMAGMNLLKSEAVDRPREQRQRKLQATTTRFSPWTRMQAEAPTEADPLGGIIQGAATGAMGMQAFQQHELQSKLAQAQIDRLRAGLPGVTQSSMAINPWSSPQAMYGGGGYGGYSLFR